eukprot:9740223-Lingulodinium_polyedra.AAC.1
MAGGARCQGGLSHEPPSCSSLFLWRCRGHARRCSRGGPGGGHRGSGAHAILGQSKGSSGQECP